MAETSFATGANGHISSQAKTVYVQGNKQRVEFGNVAEITDLDKSMVYIVNRHDQAYVEMPLQAPSPSAPHRMPGKVILKKTSEARVVANHRCNEYRTVEGNELQRVTISACVSTSAPGVQELSGFAGNIVKRLSGRKFERSADNGPAGLMLEKESVLSLRVPDSSPGRTYRSVSYSVGTRVNKITLQPLPPETFCPPHGYSRLQNLPSRPASGNAPILMSSI